MQRIEEGGCCVSLDIWGIRGGRKDHILSRWSCTFVLGHRKLDSSKNMKRGAAANICDVIQSGKRK